MRGGLRWIFFPAAGAAGLLALGLLAAPLALRAAPRGPEADPAGKKLTSFRLPDSEGKVRTLEEFRERKALVLVFLGTSCPVANGYAGTLSALQQQYAGRGVQVLGVNANPGETAEEVAKHAREYRLAFPVLRDEGQALADRLGARITPEAFLLDQERVVRYRGRIDDAYATRTRRSQVRSHDLQAALEAVLAGRPVPTPVTEGVGCAIVRPARPAAAARVTFHRDVAPVLQARCQSCHRPGQVAPFSLLTYRDAQRWAQEIKTFTAGRRMPPWLAEPGHGDFQDVRRLSDAEIRTLAEWADAGAPEGDPKDAPPARAWSDEWMLGKPDLVLSPNEEYTVAAAGDDEFRVFVLPTNLPEDRQVVAIDFRPGNPRVVHHLLTFADTTGGGRKLDEKDPGPGYTSGPGGVKVRGAALQGVWAPGNLPRFLPPGVGRPLKKGADILIQVHYHKTGKEEKDRTQVALYFAKEPVKQTAITTLVGPFKIDIPPGASRHEVKASIVLPLGVKVLTIMPHMHLLGKEMKVTATLPDGTVRPMVWIKDWDYRWQDSYRYAEPLALPKGTKIEVVAYHDNSAANPRNPSSPPRRVRFGEQTTDEMAFAIMEFVLDLPARRASAAAGTRW
jgi:peroxiredoxin/mono/diheme cytochrome c family protein